MRHLLTVIAIVLAFACCTTEADRSRMRAELDSINQRNRNDQPFTAADVQPYVDFFDDHGTPNDRLLAHYLLGRAYHENGEAPMALQCYQDALDCADTLSTDCDYAQLARVYGQMAQIFYEQGLYREQLSYDKLSVKYAWRGKDTLIALMSYEQNCQAYRNLNRPDSLLYICEHVSQIYRRYGYTRYAAIALAGTFSTLVLRQEFDKVRRYMKIYESESEYFDSLGNIQRGREIYYRLKGLYFLHTNVLDSAEYYFRKELRDGKDFNNQHAASKGLVELYQKLHKSDSVAKYSMYAYAMSDSLYAKRTTKEVERLTALYNYNRLQKKADAESRRAERLWYYLLLSTFSIVLLILVAVIVGYILVQKKRRQEEETKEIRKDYDEAISKKDQLSIEMDMLKANHEQLMVSEQEAKNKLETVMSNNNQLIQAREKEIAELNDKIRDYAQRLIHSDEMVGESPQFMLMIEEFHKKAERKRNTSMPTKLEWEHFVRLFAQTQPKAYAAIGREQTLSPQELKACILLLLKFANSEVMALLNISSQSLTNVKSRINEKLFGISNASTLENKIKEIPIV